jgi:ABC-type polysaccharide/polyol phosphate transport system ATPase subunit
VSLVIDLSIEHVSKRYRIRSPGSTGSTLRRIAGRFIAQQHDFWALRDVSLQVSRGETIGIIGHNGAGKSTLMKLLSGITAPSEGEIRIRGRLAALIELGSGFHPELTGRENVFMSGAVLGMRRREIAAKFDGIVEFAGIGDFVDVPVKWYSSGMYVRLGFAIAAHVDVDILLVDEVLAVGDAAFQSKCFTRIEELRRSGTTIVMITHDLGAIERLAERAVLLDHGKVMAIGPAREVVATYEQAVKNAKAGMPEESPAGAPMTIPGGGARVAAGNRM